MADAVVVKDSNFKQFIHCKDETNDMAKSLFDASSAKATSLDGTVDTVVKKLQDCIDIGTLVKKDAETVESGDRIIEAVDISQKRMIIDQKILVGINNNKVNNGSTQTLDAKTFQALQLANGYAKMAEDIAWTKITIRSNATTSVNAISFYNFFSVIFIVYFVFFIYKRKKKV